MPAAQPLYLPVFEHAQQLGLQWKGQGRDLIQKKGAGVGQLNLPWFRIAGAGKGAPFVAEELRLDQVLGQCCAIQADEWLVPSAAEGNDGARHQFFARAAFSANNDVDAAVGHLGDRVVDPPHRFACPHQILELAALQHLLLHARAFHLFDARFERGLENQAQLRRIDRTMEVGVASRFDRPASRLRGRATG